MQFQQVASARHPTKANTAKALVALWLDGFSLKPANHHSTPNLGHQALLISCGLHGHRHKLDDEWPESIFHHVGNQSASYPVRV